MEQAAHDVSGVHAADALDGAARDRLAVGHDGQRLERGRREPHGVRTEVAGDEPAALGRGAQHDLLARAHQADATVAQLHLEVAQAGVHRLAVQAGQAARAPRG